MVRRSTDRTVLGAAGERIAVAYLERQGWRVVAERFRSRRAEIDVIAIDPHGGSLVFVEVKTRRNARFGDGAEAVDARKLQRMRMGAGAFLAAHAEYARRPLRFDVVVVTSQAGVLTVESHLRGVGA